MKRTLLLRGLKLNSLSLLLLSFFIISCSDKTLQREDAEQLLKEQIQTEQIKEVVSTWMSQKSLRKAGYLSYKKKKWGNNWSGGTTYYDFKLDSKAKEFLINQSGTRDKPKYTFLIGEKVFGEITGIIQSPESIEAKVEYTLASNYNEFGKKAFSKKNSIKTYTATFSLFDDGWRISKNKIYGSVKTSNDILNE